jgi:hypothetical protein
VAAVSVNFQGGTKLDQYLAALATRMTNAKSVRVGFLENARYPATANKPGLHVATVAFWNEFGTINAPARPFFRYTIAMKSPKWGPALAKFAAATNYDGQKTLTLMGLMIQNQIRHSINVWSAPPNEPSTISRKGFDHPLIETAYMLRSVDYQVLT